MAPNGHPSRLARPTPLRRLSHSVSLRGKRSRVPAAPSALDRLGAAAQRAKGRSIESQYESLQRLLSGVRGHLDDDEEG